jgi:DNA-nicking Smr family endonuclease
MSKPLDESETKLFRDSVADAEPLGREEVEPYRRRPPPRPIEQPAHLRERDDLEPLSEAEVSCTEYLEFSRPGVQKRLFSDLQRGYLEVDLELDLHGLTASFAEQTLDEFLLDCARRGVRCARIIHGKGFRSDEGQPVLKRKVNYWLRRYKQVLAFCSATRRDGGTGAVYVLLRNPRKAQRERRR